MYGRVDGKGRKIVLSMSVVVRFGFYEEECVENDYLMKLTDISDMISSI